MRVDFCSSWKCKNSFCRSHWWVMNIKFMWLWCSCDYFWLQAFSTAINVMWWCICCHFSARLHNPPWPPKAWIILVEPFCSTLSWHKLTLLLLQMCIWSSQKHDDDDVWGPSHMAGCNVYISSKSSEPTSSSVAFDSGLFLSFKQSNTPLLKSGSNLNVSPDWVNQVVLMHVHCSNTADGSHGDVSRCFCEGLREGYCFESLHMSLLLEIVPGIVWGIRKNSIETEGLKWSRSLSELSHHVGNVAWVCMCTLPNFVVTFWPSG